MSTVEFTLYVIVLKGEGLYIDNHNNLNRFRERAKLFYSQHGANCWISDHLDIGDKLYINHQKNMEVREWVVSEKRD